ncbi:MAG: TIGR03560 family F420-dependent LLM class oxidoreductase [Actinobacteria bacterium]|nr:TIGR03560 family F420-dependent LLM class oxidoreductase [Actinomycetota bacterium]
MRIGIDVSQHQLSWDELLARVHFAEDAGFDGAWVFDHFKVLYGPSDGPCFEAWTLLAALAAATSRIRLGPLVTGVTYRHPSILATEVVTVDHVSGGRVELAIGAAWFGQEHEELGLDFPRPGERMDRLDEALQVMTALMTEDGASFEGHHYRLRNATYRPRPVQQPHPPIWIGGHGERRLLPLAAKWADMWHGFGSVSDLTRKSRLLDRLIEEAGRDPASVGRSSNLSLSEPWDEVRRQADGLRDAGFSYLVASWPAEGRPRMDEFVDRVLPELLEAS